MLRKGLPLSPESWGWKLLSGEVGEVGEVKGIWSRFRAPGIDLVGPTVTKEEGVGGWRVLWYLYKSDAHNQAPFGG